MDSSDHVSGNKNGIESNDEPSLEYGNEPPFEEFMEIAGSPIAGLTLGNILRGHTDVINRIAWSRDGHYLASPSNDTQITVWDVERGEIQHTLQGHRSGVISIEWSPDGQSMISRTVDEIFIWDLKLGMPIHRPIFEGSVEALSLSPDGRYLAIGTTSHGLYLKETQTWAQSSNLYYGSYGNILSVNWSPDSFFLASTSSNNVVNIWEAGSGRLILRLDGHENDINNILWLPGSNNFVISASTDHTIRIWNISTGRSVSVLEGHTAEIVNISLSFDGKLLVSSSKDNEMIIWRTDNWSQVAKLYEYSGNWEGGLAFSPTTYQLATLCERGTAIRIWDVDYDVLIKNAHAFESIRYTTAKIVLVGDSGMGKTGLGWRLAHNEYKEHSSTHGQYFWIIPELGQKRRDGTECEAVLWDLAGQHNYRSTHSIFLDNVDAALVLFDASNHQDPLKGVEFWLSQLAGKGKLPPTILVGSRSDVSPTNLSMADLEQFCQKYGISGGFVSTSARSGDGLNTLLWRLRRQIPWDQMSATTTTITFKRIKEYVLSLKEKIANHEPTSHTAILVSPDKLRQQLQATDKDWRFSNAEMMTAVGHLQTHGYVSILRSSAGEDFILLAPHLLANLASSIVSLADNNIHELGAISEKDLLQGRYQFEELKGLERFEQQILLGAAILRFLEHSVCFRETLGPVTLLIFPGLIRQKRPLADKVETIDDMSYIVRGRVENIYALLVVLLGYTSTFTRIDQWQNQVQYETDLGEICGFRLVAERKGELELVLYYSKTMSIFERQIFQGLFEKFLYQRDIQITRFPPVSCKRGHLQQREAVMSMIQDREQSMFCVRCGTEISLSELDGQGLIGRPIEIQVNEEEALARLRNTYETYLSRVKSYRSDRSTPRCYISYADEDTNWTSKLIHDLRDAGVMVVENRAESQENSFVIIVGTPDYLNAWENSIKRIHMDAPLIRSRISRTMEQRSMLVPLLVEGNAFTSFPRDLRGYRAGDFRSDSLYVVNLFDLILTLYEIVLDQPAFEPLRKNLLSQWRETLGRKKELPQKGIYISYAWGGESEDAANKLDNVFQEKGITIIRDKRDLGYKGRIKAFMETIGKGKAVILVINEKYLKSESCMFELLQIAKQGQFIDRIFPIVLDDTKIYAPVDRIRYVSHWEQKIAELDKEIHSVGAANLHGFREDIDLYTEIRASLPELAGILKDMNTLSAKIHRETGYQQLFNDVVAKLEE